MRPWAGINKRSGWKWNSWASSWRTRGGLPVSLQGLQQDGGIDVTSAGDGDGRQISETRGQSGCDGYRAGGFEQEVGVEEDPPDRRQDGGIRDGAEVVDELRGDFPGEAPGGEGAQTVRHSFGALQHDRFPGLAGAGEPIGAGRFRTDDPRLRAQALHRRGDPGEEPAPADRHDHGLDIRAVLDDLQSGGALTGDDQGIVVRRDV